MDIRNCSRCGKMYSYMGGIPICPDCKKKDEEDFQTVKEYINDNPGVSMKDISEACEVSVEKITRFLREGRLEIKEGTNIILECEKCGTSIKSGRLCHECSKRLERDMSRAVSNNFGQKSTKDEEDTKKKDRGMKYLKSE